MQSIQYLVFLLLAANTLTLNIHHHHSLQTNHPTHQLADV